MAELVVILGAGASRASTPRAGNPDYVPPLTTDLFSPLYAPVLRNYPLAETAAADIRVIVSSGALAIEQFLRERLRESDDPFARRRYRQVPLYLQELLGEVSQHYTPHPDNLDRLVNATLALESVVFVTLNYDTILDSRLVLQTDPIMSMADYIGSQPKWALIKLHGSVNWAWAVDGADVTTIDARMLTPFDKLGDGLEQALDPEIHLRHLTDLQAWRLEGSRLFFPALSVPLGSKDELVCDPKHVQFLQERLQTGDGLNLLVIGYSGVDVEVLRLLRESKNSLRSLLVINHGAESAQEAHDRIMEQFGGGEPPGPGVWSADFNDWAQTAGLDDYFTSLE